MTENGPVDIEIKDKTRLPVGKTASFFPRSIREIVNDHCDLHYDCWTKVPIEMKRILENHVKLRILLFMCIMPLATNNVTKF
jgi:hypothetical protein